MKSKKIASFLTNTILILNNEKFKSPDKNNFLEVKKTEIAHGIYCPLNFENSYEEISALNEIILLKTKPMNNNNNLIISNPTCFLLRISTNEKLKDLNKILQNILQYKMKIYNLIISSNLNDQISESIELFNQNFTLQNFVIFLSFLFFHFKKLLNNI